MLPRHEIKAQDTDFEDHVVREIQHRPAAEGKAHGYYDLSLDEGGLGIGVSDEYGVEPKPGDTIRLYGGFGHPVRGMDVNGRELYYRTPAEERERHRQWVEEQDREKREDFETSGRAELDAKFDALPELFQRRIQRFRENQPDFRWKYEAYEMTCCVDAVRIGEALRGHGDPSEAIETFQKLPYEEQKKVVPDLDPGHSGNTFGMAVRLAFWYLTQPDNVWKDHAAIAALVGCDEAGCPPVREPAEAAHE